MPRKAADVATGLQKKGFEENTKRKDIHYHLYLNGKKTRVFTMISHGEKEIHDGLIGTMARQVGLSKKEFSDLIDCPLSQDDYVVRLREQGKVQ